VSGVPAPSAVTTPAVAARREIDAEIRHPGDVLYTEQALARAAAVLEELYAAAGRHGLGVDDFRLSGLAGPALHAVRTQSMTGGPPARTSEQRGLLDWLAAALTARGLSATVRTEHDFPYVAVARTAAMPPLGPAGHASIWVGLGGDEPERATGWTAAVDLQAFAPGCDIVASYDPAGVAAVADVIAAFAAGRTRNPFQLF
jgi:hypothetical protein